MGTRTRNTPTTPTTPTTTPVVVFTPPVPNTPKVRKGVSTVPNPVGVTWVHCMVTLHGMGYPQVPTTNPNPNTLPQGIRGTLTKGVTGLGVTYYTNRTQVNRYLQWYRTGCNPTTLPKGVVVTVTP